MTKVLIINQSSGYLVFDLAECLSSQYQITLISGGKVTRKAFLSKVVPFCAYRRSSLFSRFFSWLFFSIQCLVYLWVNPRKYKHIILYSNPPILIFFLFPWSKHISYVFFDLYPDALMSLRAVPTVKTIHSLWIKLSSPIFSKMRAIVFITDEMKDLFLDAYHSNSTREFTCHVAPLWFDSNILTSYEKCTDHSPFQSSSAAVNFFYSGNFGQTHPVEIIVDSFLSNSYCYSRQLYLFGSGVRFKRVSQIASRVNTVHVNGFLSHADYVAYLKHAQVGIVCIDSISGNLSLPSKLFAMLACGLPILAIAPHNSSLAKIVDKYQCGIVADPDIEIEISDAFVRLGEDSSLRDQFGRNSLLASSHFTKANAKNFLDILSDNL